MEPLLLKDIKNTDDLKKVLKFLDEQGFGYIAEWELHQKKIDHIISKNNTLTINHDSKLKNELIKLKDYDEIDKEAKNYFSKFNVDDKVSEYLNTFYIHSDDSCSAPSNNPGNKEIIEWVNFRTKYDLKDEFNPYTRIDYYNLDKNYIKVNYGTYKDNEFERFYQIIFNEKCDKLESKKSGEWNNIGKIEIKFFQNGSANLKGDLTSLKKYYYKYIKNKNYNNTVIKYNGKTEIIIKSKEY